MGSRRRGRLLAVVLVVGLAGAVPAATPPAIGSDPGAVSGLLPGLLHADLLPGLLNGGDPRAPADGGDTPKAAPAPHPVSVIDDGGYSAHAAGVALSADVGLLADLAHVEVGSARAAYRGGTASARGTGLDVAALPGILPALGTAAESTSPPAGGRVVTDTAALALGPVLSATALRGEAEARTPAAGCLLGPDLASSEGRAGGLSVGDLGGVGVATTGAPDAARGALWSSARTRLAAAPDGAGLAVVAEVRQTIAPVTFLAGTPGQFTVELGGEWVLRAHAGGGTGRLTYGPEGAPPGTPVVRVLDASGRPLASLTLEELAAGPHTAVAVPGVAEVVLGDVPGPLAGAAAPGSAVSAAVDVVRIRLLDGATDLRIGHMEVAVAAPGSGPTCPGVTVTGRAAPPVVSAGGEGAFLLEVANPNDGVLTDLAADLSLVAGDGAAVEVVGTEPPAASAASASGVAWPALGSLGPGESRSFTVRFRVPAGSGAGRLTAELRARGRYAAAGDEHIPAGGTAAFTAAVEGPAPGAAAPAPGPPAAGAPPDDAPSGAGPPPDVREPAPPPDDRASRPSASVPPSAAGEELPPAGEEPPPAGEEPPRAGEEPPRAGEESPAVAAPAPPEATPPPRAGRPAGRGDGDGTGRLPWAVLAVALAALVGAGVVGHGRGHRRRP